MPSAIPSRRIARVGRRPACGRTQSRSRSWKLDAWLEARRLAADARRDLSEMSDRELRDIGLDRGDIAAVVHGGSPRTAEERIRCHHLRSVDAVVNVPRRNGQ